MNKNKWIRIHFLRIQIQLIFSMWIRIQLLLKCGPGSSLNEFVKNYLLKSFLEMKKTK